MTRYLVVAYQTAASPELAERVTSLAAADPAAEFVLLVPATSVQHLLTWAEGEARAVAAKAAEDAKARFEKAGVNVVRVAVGDESPLLAIEDELLEHPGDYDAMIICTFPAGISRWLRLDLPSQAQRKFEVPAVHVVAQPAAKDEG